MPTPLFSYRIEPSPDGTRVVMRGAIPRERDGKTHAKQAFFLLPVELSERVKGSVQGSPGPAMVALIDWALAQLEHEHVRLVVEEKP